MVASRYVAVNWRTCDLLLLLFAGMVILSCCLQVGASLYACRWPECRFPGKFDLVFSSHQLFHICVVVAATIHYKAVFQLLAWRDATGGPAGCATESKLQSLLTPS